MNLEKIKHEKAVKRRLLYFSFIAFLVLVIGSSTSYAFSLENWYQNNADILENNSVAGLVMRNIIWGVTKVLVTFANACETIYDTAFGFIDFTKSAAVNRWIVKFKPAVIALMALSLVALGITLIMQHEKKPKIMINICLCVLCVCCSTVVFAQLNSFTNAFKEGVEKTVSASKIAYSTVNNNIADLVYLDDKYDGLDNINWNDKKVHGAGIKNKKTFDNVDYTEVLNYDSENYNYHGETKDILQNKLIILSENGKSVASSREIYNGFGWNSGDDTDLLNEFYYRYTLDWLTTWLQLVALVIIYLTMSYKCIRIIFELVIARLLAYLYSAELSGGEKIKKILIFIRDSYILLCVTVICIKVYDMLNAVIANEVDGLIKGIFALFLAFCVIDGPNLVEKLLGMDAGLKSSTARMMAIGRAGIGAMHTPSKVAKGAYNASSGSFERGGLAGAAVGAVIGKKQADGSRSGGLAGMMNKNADEKERDENTEAIDNKKTSDKEVKNMQTSDNSKVANGSKEEQSNAGKIKAGNEEAIHDNSSFMNDVNAKEGEVKTKGADVMNDANNSNDKPRSPSFMHEGDDKGKNSAMPKSSWRDIKSNSSAFKSWEKDDK